jgi:hypothetical protein
MINRLLFILLAVLGALNAGAQAIDAFPRTTTFTNTDLLLVQTNSAGAAGQKFSRSITASNFLESLKSFGNFASGLGTMTTVKTNAGTVSSTASSLAFIEGTNVTLRATNAAGVVTVQINASGGSGSVDPTNAVLANLISNPPYTNIGNGLKVYSTALSKLDPAVTFPAYNRAVDLNRPITVFGMGDSVGHLTGTYVYQFLSDYYGYAGFANYAGNDFSVGTSASLVTALSYNTNWYGLHHIGTNGGYMTWSNAYNTFGAGGVVQADKLNIYYVANTNGGGFNIEVRTNGGAFAVVQSVQSKSYSPTGMVATVDLLNGYYQAKVSFTNFQTDIIGASLFQTNVPGVRWGMTYGPGAPYYFLTNVPAAVAGPILRSIAPTLLLIESAGDSTIDASNSVANWMTLVGNTLTNTDIVLLGTAPTDPVSAYKWAENNQELKNVAAVYPQLIYFDQSQVSGSYSNIQHLGLAGDGLHRSNRLDMMFASELLRLAGANNGYHGTAMELLNRSNSFSGLTRFEDRVTLSPGKTVRWEDSVSGADVRLNISMINAQAIFNVFQTGVSDVDFLTYDMANSAVWFANGVELGTAARPTVAFTSNLVNQGTLKLAGGTAGSSLLRTDSSTNVGTVTIGSGLSFDGTTLTASGGGSLATNSSQFGASVTLTIASGALLTNLQVRGIDPLGLTASRALSLNASGDITNGTTTAAELEFVNGVTSAIQTQLNGKQNGQTNSSQFGASTVLTIADRASLTNINVYGTGAVFSGHVTVASNITAQSFIGSGTGTPILKLQTMMSADNAFAISVRTNFTQSTTNFFEVTNASAGQAMVLHSAAAGQLVWTNATATGGGSTNLAVLAVGVLDATNQIKHGSVTYSNNWQIAQEGTRITRMALAKEASTTIDQIGVVMTSSGTAAAGSVSSTNESRVLYYTAATINTDAGAAQNSTAIRPGRENRVHTSVSLISGTNELRAWVAISDDALTSLTDRDMPTTKNVVGIRYNSNTNSNWWFVTSNGSSATNVDTGVALTGEHYRARISLIETVTSTTTNWVAWINGLPVATNTAFLPVAPMKYLNGIRTLNGSAKTNAFEFYTHTAAP